MSLFLKKFGKQIKKQREASNLTQEALAEKVGVATTTISLWENGKFFLEYPSIVKLCAALNITEEDLFSFASETLPKNISNQINNIVVQLSEEKQKQLLEFLKTFA